MYRCNASTWSVFLLVVNLNLQPTTVLLSPLSVALRKSAVYMCMTQLWHSLHGCAEVTLETIERGQPCEREIVALSLSLSSRIYLAKLNSMQDTGNSCHGELLTSYESISPAPSELALLNTTYSVSKPMIEVNFQEVFEKVEFNGLIVLKDCLISLFSSVGLKLAPQLRSSHVDSSEMYVDLKAVLKEVAIFILECTPTNNTSLPPPASPSPPPGIPAIVFSQLSITGCLKVYQDVSTNTATPSLLTTAGPSGAGQARTNVSSQFCVSLDSVTTVVNVPLLRCARHLVETGRLRSAWRRKRHEKPQGPDLGTCVIQVEEDVVQVGGAMGGASMLHRAEGLNVWEFSQTIVGMLRGYRGDQGATGGSAQESTDGAPPTGAAPPTDGGPPPSPDDVQLGPLVADYAASPALRKTHGLPVGSKTSSEPVPIPLGFSGLSDSSNHNNAAKGLSSTGSTTSDSSDDGVSSVAIAMEGQPLVASTDPSDHDLGTSPSNAHLLGTSGAAGSQLLGNRPNIGDHPVSSNQGDHPDGGDHQNIPRTPAIAVKSSGVVSDSWPVNKSLALQENELLFSVHGLLKVNNVEFAAQVESVRIVLELLGISAAVDVRKAAVPDGSRKQQDASLSECRCGLWVGGGGLCVGG